MYSYFIDAINSVNNWHQTNIKIYIKKQTGQQ